MRVVSRLVALAALVTIGVSSVTAQEIKLASVAPEASPFGNALNQLAADWARISGGRVHVRVYHNAIAGDETDILRKMRIGQLQAAVLTSSGLKQIVPEVFSVSVPFLIDTPEELATVMGEIRPDLDAAFEADRLHVLAWSRAGWVHFFSKDPVTYPEDLKHERLATDPNDEELQQAFRVMGYRPIPIPTQELLASLNSGLVDAFYTSPLVAAGYQWFGIAPNMLGVRVAPLLGAIVITDSAWRRIPDAIKDQLQQSAEAVATQIETQIQGLEDEALTTMQRYGLHVQEATPDVVKAWETDVHRYDDSLLQIFEPKMTARIQAILARTGTH